MRQLGEKVAARDVARKVVLPFLPISKSAIENIDCQIFAIENPQMANAVIACGFVVRLCNSNC